MAWNKPGGNGSRDPDRDPWGDRGGQQGPPDLDEALKKLQNQLGRIFGGKSGGGGSGGGGFKLGAGGSLSLGLVALVALGLWVFAGIFIVEPAEQGVVTRFGKFARTVGPGPHWAPKFIEEVTTVDVQQVRSEEIGFSPSRGKVPSEALMLTADENIVDLEFAVQYRVSDAKDYLFQVRDPVTTLRQAIESAVREVVGRNTTDFVLTEGRDAVASEVQTLSQDILDRYRTGVIIESTNMQDAQPPEEVQEAFLDAIKAREDQVRVINEAKAYSNDLIPKARGEAEAIKERAEGYKQRVTAAAEGEADRFVKVLTEYRKAPEVTRERLYLETVESVMGNASKVMVDIEGGNNLMYLPLDKLINQDGDRRTPAGTPGAVNPTPSADLGRGINRRSRDGRSR
jgi:membrane protease subunit HflK